MQRAQTFASEQFISTPTRVVPLRVIRNARARRYLLRLKPDGSAQLTIPRRGCYTEAHEFLQRNIAWLERAAQRQAARPRPDPVWRLGSSICWRGELVVIAQQDEQICFGAERLHVPNPSLDLRPIIERYMWNAAWRELPPQVQLLAQRHAVEVKQVTVRNQRSRWGSCSARGTISLNWRILQAPSFVCDYLIIHELMHRREMNHSERFWRHVADACPEYHSAEAWLNKHSHLLRA